jgi:hypothetical protein
MKLGTLMLLFALYSNDVGKLPRLIEEGFRWPIPAKIRELAFAGLAALSQFTARVDLGNRTVDNSISKKLSGAKPVHRQD